MSHPLGDMVPPGEEGFGIHIIATGDEWSYLDGPDPRKTEKDWSTFDPQQSNLTPVPQVLAELRGSPTP